MKALFFVAIGLVLMAESAFADGDAKKGANWARSCTHCHDVSGAANRIGPYLKGIVGRPVAAVEGYAYSEAMKTYGADGKVWDEARLNSYIENPKGIVPGNKMNYAGVKQPAFRTDIIAYLKTLQ